MSRRSAFPALLLIVFPAFCSCQELSVKDDTDRVLRLSAPPKRIVSLAPNITEILFALGLEDRIAGVTDFCDYPPLAKEKAKIGGMVNPNLELIQALRPDLIIGFRGNSLRFLIHLRKIKLPVFILDPEPRLESVFHILDKLGKATRTEKEASLLVAGMKKKLDQVRDKLASVRQRPKVLLSLHATGLWTCGKNSFLNDLIVKAGGQSISGDIPRRWFHLNREQVLFENPTIIILLAKSRDEFERSRERLTGDVFFQKIAAVEKGSIFFLDENLASRPGPRIFDALEEVAAIFHPGLFGKQR